MDAGIINPAPHSPPHVTRVSANDAFDLGAKVSSFNFEVRQLRPGEFSSEITMISLGQVTVTTGHINQSMLVRVGVREGTLSVSHPGPGSAPLLSAGRLIAPDECFVGGPGGVTETTNVALLRPCMLSVNIDQLQRGNVWLEEWLLRPKRSVRIQRPGTQWVNMFTESISWVAQAMDAFPDSTARVQTRASISDMLLARINVLAIVKAPLSESRTERMSRRIAVERAREYIEARLTDSIRLAEVCKYARVQARSLEYGFHEAFGMSPVAYIRSMRLNRVRQLLSSPAVLHQSISQMALDCGFWHLSQFAVNYKEHFLESPSVTVRRTKARLNSGSAVGSAKRQEARSISNRSLQIVRPTATVG